MSRARSQVQPQRPTWRLRAWAACAAALLLCACSTARPWLNQPLPPTAAATDAAPAAPVMAALDLRAGAAGSPIIAAVTLSGGGARAAAFGLGVLEEMKATAFELDGRQTSLLDEVGVISGVSGGSILAGYYAAFGDEVFTRFEPDFLLFGFQSGLLRDLVSPDTLYRLSSPWWGRSDALREHLDRVYRGTTFGDLRSRNTRLRLLVTATDVTTGAPFEFTPEQFGQICSDLDSVPLSFAVAASSAVPLLLSPMTVRNFAGSCPGRSADTPAHDENLSARLRHMIASAYRNADERPYIHLVDGGLADNLGVRGLLDRAVAGGSLRASFAGLAPGSVRKIVLVSVNSERDTSDRIDQSDMVPGSTQVLDALLFGAGSRLTAETTAMVDHAARQLSEELQAERDRPGSPFAPDAEIHVIHVSLRDLHDPSVRHLLLRVPTALTIAPGQVRALRAAGRSALRDSEAFARLRRSLGPPAEAAVATISPASPPAPDR